VATRTYVTEELVTIYVRFIFREWPCASYLCNAVITHTAQNANNNVKNNEDVNWVE